MKRKPGCSFKSLIALTILGRPTSRYSSRVLNTAPSQCVWGMTHRVGFLVMFGSSAFANAPGSRPQQAANMQILTFMTFLSENCAAIDPGGLGMSH